MYRLTSIIQFIFFLVILNIPVAAQQFTVDNSSLDTFSGGGAYDGTNILYTIMGDAQSIYGLNVQFVSSEGVPSGPRISLGKTGSGAMAAFDGENYLIVWTDEFYRMAGGDSNGFGNLYGQFISKSGTLIGTTLTFVSNINIKFGQGRGSIVFQDSTYFITYLKGNDQHSDYLYRQKVDKSGNLSGTPVQISEDYAREQSIAFDGTNYLIAWCKCDYPGNDSQIYGQFVNKLGNLVGQNFLIDGSSNASDNPVNTAYDGSRYLVCFHDLAADNSGRWNLIGRFVTSSGSVEDRFTVCDSSKNPFYASPATDGLTYLITWMQYTDRMMLKGRYFSKTGVPLDTPFTLFDTLDGKYPVGGVGGFLNGKYLIGVNMLDNNNLNGDIYGIFLSPYVTGISKDDNSLIKTFALSQNYPNPFNPTTEISYSVSKESFVSIKVFDILGREVRTLVNEVKSSGSFTVKFDGSRLASGVYIYKMQAGSFISSKKLVLMK